MTRTKYQEFISWQVIRLGEYFKPNFVVLNWIQIADLNELIYKSSSRLDVFPQSLAPSHKSDYRIQKNKMDTSKSESTSIETNFLAEGDDIATDGEGEDLSCKF